MDGPEREAFRLKRLRDLIASKRFDGNVSACGRWLGYEDGGALRHMLAKPPRRPLTEKTIDRWCDKRPELVAWFADETGAAEDSPPIRLAASQSEWARWRHIAEIAADVLDERQQAVNAGKFLQFIDLFSEKYPTDDPSEQDVRDGVRRHLKLVK